MTSHHVTLDEVDAITVTKSQEKVTSVAPMKLHPTKLTNHQILVTGDYLIFYFKFGAYLYECIC